MALTERKSFLKNKMCACTQHWRTWDTRRHTRNHHRLWFFFFFYCSVSVVWKLGFAGDESHRQTSQLAHRGQEVCESGGGRPGLPVPNKPYGFCGPKQHGGEESSPTLHAVSMQRGKRPERMRLEVVSTVKRNACSGRCSVTECCKIRLYS